MPTPAATKTGKEGRSAARRERSSTNDDLLEGMREMLAESRTRSDASEREKVLEHDNFKIRRKYAVLRDRVTELEDLVETGTVPEGSVVVKKEDAAELEAFRALKLKPDDMKKNVEDLAKLTKEKAETDAESVYADAAEALDFPNVAAVTKALKRESVLVEMRAVKEDDPDNPGRKITVQRAFCRKRDDDRATFEPLSDYIDREIPEFIPAFEVAPDDADDEGDGEQDEQERSRPTQGRHANARSHPQRNAPNTTTSGGRDGVAVATSRRAAAPSGLRRAQTAQDDALEAARRSGRYSM